MIGVYVLADKFGDIAMANEVVDEIIRFSKETDLLPRVRAINQAYDSTPESSPLRMLLRDVHIHEALPSVIEVASRNGVHYDFLANMSTEWCKLKFDHMNGAIEKWFRQQVAYRPKGYYHQELGEPTLKSRHVKLAGSCEATHVVEPTNIADQDAHDAELSKVGPSDLEGMPENGKALAALRHVVAEWY